MNLPLPLRLTSPVLVAQPGESHYDPRTQTCGSLTLSAACSQSYNAFNGIAVDVQVDSVVDDNA